MSVDRPASLAIPDTVVVTAIPEPTEASIGRKVLKTLVNLVQRPEFKAVWQALKALFSASPSAPMLTPEQIYTHMNDLRVELFSEMNKASTGISAQRQQAFAAHAIDMIHDVLTDCMFSVQNESNERTNRKVMESTFKQAAAKAHYFVKRHLEVAQSLGQEKLDAPMVKMVLVENPAGPYLQKVAKIAVLRDAPPIENLVLRGGGAKGIGNPPALRALANLGKLSDLKKVVGTSAGALTAVCLASGMSAQAFQNLSNDTSMLSLLSSPDDFEKRYPEVKLGTLGFGAGKALETLDRASASSVSRYLNEHWDEVINVPQWGRLSEVDQNRLIHLRDQNLEASPRTGNMITFHDLHLMHQLVPTKFRELVLTGFDASQKETAYFSAATHPDMPVALAGRISMSIPLFFKAVKMAVEGKSRSFIDGGVGSNMPSEVILNGLSGREMEDAMVKTLLMTYDEGGAAYSILHGSPDAREKATGGILSHFTNDRLDGEKIHFSGANVLPVFHGKIGTFSFAASKEQVEQAQILSMFKTLEYIENTMDSVRHDVVADADAAARLLSIEEQNQFLQKYDGDGDPLNVAICNAIRKLSLPPSGVDQTWLEASLKPVPALQMQVQLGIVAAT